MFLKVAPCFTAADAALSSANEMKACLEIHEHGLAVESRSVAKHSPWSFTFSFGDGEFGSFWKEFLQVVFLNARRKLTDVDTVAHEFAF